MVRVFGKAPSPGPEFLVEPLADAFLVADFMTAGDGGGVTRDVNNTAPKLVRHPDIAGHIKECGGSRQDII